MSTEDLLKEIRRCFKLASDSDQDQRDREQADLKFQVAEYQWDDAAKAQRAGDSGRNIPARPIMSISLLQQPAQLVQNQAASADLGVNVHPVSETANKETAETWQGLYRRVERDSGAEGVRLFAFERAKLCGRGWYRMLARYDDEGDNPFDQELALERILHQECVYIDPAAKKADFSDANWAFIVDWIPLEEFKRQYPKSKAAQAGDSRLEWEGLSLQAPLWVEREAGAKAVMVAEYWRKTTHYETLCGLVDNTVCLKEDVPKGAEILLEREQEHVTMHWYKVAAGNEILDDEECDGKWIPLIPVVGRELIPFDGDRRWEGMVRPARDGQKLFNFAASNLVERMAAETKVPWIGAEGQFEGHEHEWRDSNIRNFPYLEYKPVALGDKPMPPPQRAQLDQTGMSLAMLALQEGKGFVQAATAVYEPSLGETPKRGQSGRAVIAQQQQTDAGTSNYLQNLASITLPYEALVFLDWAPHIYDRPGRVTQILGGEEEKEKSVMLGKPYTMDQSTGQPVPAMDGAEGAQTHDLSKGKYSISVSIGKSYQTRLQQGQESLSELIPHLLPEQQILLLPVLLKFMDSPGSKEAADLLTKFRDSKFAAITTDEQGPTPEQAKAQMQGMQQQMQQMQQLLTQLKQELDTDQAKQTATLEKARIDAAKDIELMRMKNAALINVAQINAESNGAAQASEARNEQIALAEDHAFESDESQKDRAHDVAMAAVGQKAAVQQDASGRAHESKEAASGRAHEVGMAAAGAGQESSMAEKAEAAAARAAERAAQTKEGE